MRIAVLSDIHDLAAGPQPVETLDLLVALGDDSRLERWAEVFATVEPSVSTVVCGHTHMPFVRLSDRRLVVNPGSVGMPYGGADARDGR